MSAAFFIVIIGLLPEIWYPMQFSIVGTLTFVFLSLIEPIGATQAPTHILQAFIYLFPMAESSVQYLWAYID